MNNIKEIFDKSKKENRKVHGVQLVSGYPNNELFLGTLNFCADNEFDFIEVVMPFSDPASDSPVIKKAGAIALKNGITISKTIEIIKEFKKTNKNIPIIWTGYFNAIYNYGTEKFLDDIENAGIEGIHVADLPMEEYTHIKYIENKNVYLINQITSNTSAERLKKILQISKGFISFVAIDNNKQTVEHLKQFKNKLTIPIITEFNIERNKVFNQYVDGYIVNSEIIEQIENYIYKNNTTENLFEYLKNTIINYK